MNSRFQKTLIVGLGLIGGSLAAAFKKFGVAGQVAGIDYPATIQKAIDTGVIAAGAVPTDESGVNRLLKQADLIFLATPISGILGWLQRVAGNLKTGALITDVGSTKERIVATAKERLSGGVYFLGGHPMAGSESGGFENANPLLFQNAVYVVTENPEIPAAILIAFQELLASIGAQPLIVSAEVHDRVAARMSHLPQVLATSLMNYVYGMNHVEPSHFQLAAGGFRDMTRVAESSIEIWRDIFRTNQTNIISAIDDFVEEMQIFKQRLLDDDIADYFQSGVESHAHLREQQKV